ncbi:MAG: BtaA family protein, partial [Planctomycetales bacterium]|nr:BtaA family protein [Planctomycetales bacterium]
NTCWEDPRLDRVALELGPGDRLLVITSAGCNALDYALDEPERIDTVDSNPRQNALLELKKAAIRALQFEEFFQMFGRGRVDNWDKLYPRLRPAMPAEAQKYWDKNGKFFLGEGRRCSFYFRGSAGLFAWGINDLYIDRWVKIRPAIERMLAAETLEEQSEIFHRDVKSAFWGPWIKWFMRRDATLSLLGVPRAQRKQLERHYPGGIVQFIEDRLETVFSKLPLKDNYFWRVYLTGEYTRECCPNYLKEENFHRLKEGLADRVHTHTNSILEHLQQAGRKYSHFVLLDHMDWMAEHLQDVLKQQWQAIVDNADDGARFLWRGAAVICDFVDPIEVQVDGHTRRLGQLLEYDRELADELHAKDRVNTYGSFSIATLHRDPSRVQTSATQAQSDSAQPASTDDSAQPAKNPVPPDALAHTR